MKKKEFDELLLDALSVSIAKAEGALAYWQAALAKTDQEVLYSNAALGLVMGVSP